MPNLKNLNLYHYPGPSLPFNMLYNLPGLESFQLLYSEVETIPDDFFTYVTSCRYFMLSNNKIQTIDLGSLNPNSWVVLSNNQIKQLPEMNFRPFVENVLQTPNAVGNVVLFGECLFCNCLERIILLKGSM